MRVEIDPNWWTSATWDGRPIRDALERRDITAIFRFLHARGISYGAIGGLVGVSPNRAAEIAKNVRQVTAYDVLERIAVGLRIPRAMMGLGRDADAALQKARRPADAATLPAVEACCRTPAAADLPTLRKGLDEVLAFATVSSHHLEMIEESTNEHVRRYPATPPTVVLSRIAAECSEVLALSRRRQPAMIQARLSGTAALLATMCADAMMRLGESTDAGLWYRTAVLAADDSAQPHLRVLVRAQAAMLPYYYGDPRQALALTDEALALPAPACSARALAAAGRARALARLGASDDAERAVRRARELFDEAGDDDSDAAFRFPAKRLLLYLSGAAAWSADTRRAFRVQDEALALYRSSSALIDPALILLDRAMCLAATGHEAEAAGVAHEAIAALPEPQCTEIVLTRAYDTIAAVSPARRPGEITGLAEYLHECRRHTRTVVTGPERSASSEEPADVRGGADPPGTR